MFSIRRRIRELEARLAVLESQNDLDHVDDALYAAIEDRFRGAPEVIRSRQARYIPHLGSVTPQNPALDLGCGRGEWLDVLGEKGIAARGVDSNAKFVDSCRRRGLVVEQGDILDVLRATPAGSVGAVTMFQVAEHLPLSTLIEVLEQARRVLVANGVLIVEVPHIETLRVGAATFWIDPTHRRPLFPDYLELLVERAGFSHLRRELSTPLAERPANLDPVVAELWERVNGPGDIAVIATTPPA